jgi:TolB protein
MYCRSKRFNMTTHRRNSHVGHGLSRAMLVARVLLLFLLPVGSALAQTDVYIRGSGKLFPIALPQLCAREGQSNAVRDIPKVIARDLDLSGYFEVLNPGAYIESAGKCAGAEEFAYSDWSVIGAEGLVRGTVQDLGDRIKVQLYLHDVQRQKVVLAKEFEAESSQSSRIAHRFANEILRFFTGAAGIFGTEIAFSSRIGRFKELFVMDMDGSNLRQLTNDRSLSMSVTWSPDGRSLAFTSYRLRAPDLFLVDVFSKRLQQITRGSEMELGAKFFPGQPDRLLASITAGRESDIVEMNLQGVVQRKLTATNSAIDVSPDFSPDGQQVVFCSNRGGGPQIYVMNSQGGAVRRVSYVTSGYCTSPDWSPKGDRIAFVCRADGGFQLFVADPDGSNPLQLTSYGDNEDPDFSPDGRYIAFSSTFGKKTAPSIAMIRVDGSAMRQLSQSRSGDSDPAWGPLLP